MISSLFFLTKDASVIAKINFTEKVGTNELSTFWGQPLFFPLGSEGTLRCATRRMESFSKNQKCSNCTGTRFMVAAANSAALEMDSSRLEYALEKSTDSGVFSSYYSTFIRRQEVIVVSTMEDEVFLTVVLSVLNHIVDMVSFFLQGFSEDILRDNFSTVHQLLHEIMDFGYPLMRYDHELASVVSKPTLENKVRLLLDAPHSQDKAGGGGGNEFASGYSEKVGRGVGPYGARSEGGVPLSTGGALLPPALGSDHDTAVPIVPWRSVKNRASPYHAGNELLFDVVERIDCVMDTEGHVAYAAIRGAIDVNAKISGVGTEVLVRLNLPDALQDVGLHYSVRAGLYESQRIFSFIPPDGKFTLCQYTTTPALIPTFGTSPSSTAHASLIPFYVTPQSFLEHRSAVFAGEGQKEGGEANRVPLLPGRSHQYTPMEETSGYPTVPDSCEELRPEDMRPSDVSLPSRQITREGRFSCIVGWRGGGAPHHGPKEVKDVTIRLRFSRHVSHIHVESCNRGEHHVVLAADELHWHIDTLGTTAPYMRGTFTLANEEDLEELQEAYDVVKGWKRTHQDIGKRSGTFSTPHLNSSSESCIGESSLPLTQQEATSGASLSTTPTGYEVVALVDPEEVAASRPPVPVGISAQIEFSIVDYSVSRIKIASVHTGERASRGRGLSSAADATGGKLFKGVKYTTKAGNFLIRTTS